MKKLVLIFGSILTVLIFVILIRFIIINETVTYGINSSKDSLHLQLNIAREKPDMNVNCITDGKKALQMVKIILGEKKYNFYKPWNVDYDEYYNAWEVSGSVGTPFLFKLIQGTTLSQGVAPYFVIKKNGEIIAYFY